MLRKTYISIAILLFSIITLGSNHNKREMRAVWVSTLLNLDWPSKSNLSNEQQKKEFVDMLNMLANDNINTVIVQIRPSGDAIYPSKYACWSEWLTGHQGVAPKPFYDPLKFMIEECHKRCMEFHAWINPFRAVFSYKKHPANPNHISLRKPEWIVTNGAHKYLNPGIPEVRKYINNIVCEVVENYDIDAIHFDDYFYPHERTNNKFDDDATFKKYRNEFIDKLEWRRNNTNVFIKDIGENIHKLKPQVKFGVSPFPVWRTSKKDTINGIKLNASSSYDNLSADVLLWVQNKWIDYVMPQLYGSTSSKSLNYATLAKWWSSHCKSVNLYTGLAIYKLDKNSKKSEWRNANEIEKQLQKNNEFCEIKGHCFFRSAFLKKNPLNITNRLNSGFHKYPALLPINNNIPEIQPARLSLVILEKKKKDQFLIWDNISSTNGYYIIYRYKGLFPKYESNNVYKITRNNYIFIPKNNLTDDYKYSVSAISRTHHESKPTRAYILNS